MITLAALGTALGILKTVFGIGALILVHELGHFLVGRWCGVRAEAFSIGFPPTVFKWQGKETEYRFGLLPLGGYVKFAGEYEDMYGEGDPAPDSFPAATYPRKAAIMLAGVAMNVVTAFVLFVITFRIGVNLVPPIVGSVAPDSGAWAAGIEVGDEIAQIDGIDIVEFNDIVQEVVLNPEIDVVVVRNGERLAPVRVQTTPEEGGVHSFGIGGLHTLTPRIAVEKGGPAYEAGFRADDEVVSVDGSAQPDALSAVQAHVAARGPTTWVVRRGDEELTLTMPRPTETVQRIGVSSSSRRIVAVRRGSFAEQVGLRAGQLVRRVGDRPVDTVRDLVEVLRADHAAGPIVVDEGGAERVLPIAADGSPAEIADGVSMRGDGTVVDVPDDPAVASSARDAGVPDGGRILTVNGRPVREFPELVAAIADETKGGRTLSLEVESPEGGTSTYSVVAEPVQQPVAFGVEPVVMPQKRLLQEDGLGTSIVMGVKLTHRWVTRILTTLGSLVRGNVSPTKLAGPVRLAKMTYQEGQKSWGDLFLFLGMISMNLAVLNLLPIPALDGGQLALITAAKIRGRPLPERLEWGIQMAGWAMVLGLMAFVIVNDIRNL